MKSIYNITLAFVLIFSLLSCKDNKEKRKEIVLKKIDLISKNQKEWDNLTNRILKDSYVISNLGLIISPNKLDNSLKQELEDKGIRKITVNMNDDCKKVEYTTNWTAYPIGTLYLSWTNCDSIQTKKGYYKDNIQKILQKFGEQVITG
jgi:meiotically up-regulated gene 157 (Mug157) protein